MWEAASDDVKRTHTRAYSELPVQQMESLTVANANSAPTTKPVIDAMVDAIMSTRPRTSYLVDGGSKGIDPDAVRLSNVTALTLN